MHHEEFNGQYRNSENLMKHFVLSIKTYCLGVDFNKVGGI